MNTNKKLFSLPIIIFSIVMTACGGGGGGGGGGGVTPVAPTTPIAITTANADAVAYTGVSAFGPVGNGISIASVTTPTSTSAATRIRILKLIKFGRDSYQKAISTAPVLAAGVVACPGGGEVIEPDTDALPFTLTYNNCIEDGLTINGSITVDGSGNVDLGPFDGSMTFNKLTISGGGDSFGINGTMNINFTVSGTTETGTITSSIVQLTSGGETIDLTGMNISYTEQYSVSEQENVRYTVNSTLLNGSVQVTTTADLVYDLTFIYDDYPYQGTMVITGANSKIILTAHNFGNLDDDSAVRVQVDDDVDQNDGFEVDKFVSWNDLESATLP